MRLRQFNPLKSPRITGGLLILCVFLLDICNGAFYIVVRLANRAVEGQIKAESVL